MTLDKETYETIKNNKHLYRYFYTAYHGQYITGMLESEAKQMFDLFNKIFNANETFTRCAKCRFNMCAKIGKLVHEYEQNNLEKEEKQCQKEIMPKKGRKASKPKGGIKKQQ